MRLLVPTVPEDAAGAVAAAALAVLVLAFEQDLLQRGRRRAGLAGIWRLRAGGQAAGAAVSAGIIGLTKALSWLDNTAGEALIAPPTMGELITLLRNNEVLMRAGARSYPLPPSGSLVLPRHTSASTATELTSSVT